MCIYLYIHISFVFVIFFSFKTYFVFFVLLWLFPYVKKKRPFKILLKNKTKEAHHCLLPKRVFKVIPASLCSQ